MDAELSQQLRTILDLEASEPIDWARVQQLSTDLSRRLPDDAPHFVHHYLADADIREKDLEYAQIQRNELRELVGR